MQPRVLICGISGQDGAYLARLLLSKGYEVWGTSRNAQHNEFIGLKALRIIDKVKILTMLPEDFRNVLQVVSDVRPSEIYNLASQSSVGLSFEKPRETISSITVGTLNQLEAIRKIDKTIRFFNAGSSECFGRTHEMPADELTQFRPESPYGIAKAAASMQVKLYRQLYGLYACTGILFNHESPLRSGGFVTKKIVDAIYRIKSGKNERLELGNINIYRDWGWASEYVEAMWLMLAQDEPEDYILATGVKQSLEEFLDNAFGEVGLNWRNHVWINSELIRAVDPDMILGNPNKIKLNLGWEATTKGKEVARKLIHARFGRREII